LPVTVIRPLPGIMAASMVSSSPPTSVQASPVTMPDQVLGPRPRRSGISARRDNPFEVIGLDLNRFLCDMISSLTALQNQGRELALEVGTPASRV